MKNKKGFTLLEILVVVAIIIILSSVILVFISQSKKNARLNNAKTALKGAILMVIACNDANSTRGIPSGTETGTRDICTATPNSHWPALQGGYTYVVGGNFGPNCNFQINTKGDSTNPGGIITCYCSALRCN